MRLILTLFLAGTLAVTVSCARDRNTLADSAFPILSVDLYGDDLYMARWQWLIDRKIIDGSVPDGIPEEEVAYYIGAFTYAVKTKIDAWANGSDFWWSPLFTNNKWQQHGYFMGMRTAGDLRSLYTLHGRMDLLSVSNTSEALWAPSQTPLMPLDDH